MLVVWAKYREYPLVAFFNALTQPFAYQSDPISWIITQPLSGINPFEDPRKKLEVKLREPRILSSRKVVVVERFDPDRAHLSNMGRSLTINPRTNLIDQMLGKGFINSNYSVLAWLVNYLVEVIINVPFR